MTRRPGKAPRTVRDASADGVDRAEVRATADAPGPILGRWTLVLDDYLPPSVNRLMRMHWAARGRLKREACVLVEVARHRVGVPNATRRRRVAFRLTVTNRSHAPDGDNVPKLILDACVICRLLVDDRAEFCELGRVEIAKGARKRTEITLEDMP
jgi:hypothetical protein